MFLRRGLPGLLIGLLVLTSTGGVLTQGAAPGAPAAPAGPSFTYQGELSNASGLVSATCDFQFSLYNDAAAGSQVGATQTVTGVSVASGRFTVTLNDSAQFGAGAFDGTARWLAIAVRCPAGSGSYAPLTPRQPLTAAPYALYALNAATLGGQPAAAFQQRAQNQLVVAKSGGDFTTITAALNSITTASASNPFVITVAPGVYSETVTMKPYVDIEGAGELTTKITATGSQYASTGTVVGSSHAELRFLTVENTGGGANTALAIYNAGTAPRFTHVTAFASGGTTFTFGMYNQSASPALTNVDIVAAGGLNVEGLYNDGSSPAMTDITATASGGFDNIGVENASGSAPLMANVIASAWGGTRNIGVENSGSGPAMTYVNAAASGPISSTNYGVYNAFSAAPTMTGVTATAAGGANSTNYGVNNTSASPAMLNVSATASGAGSTNCGVFNLSAVLTMTNVTAKATGTTTSTSYGVYNDAAMLTMTNGSASAAGGANAFGVVNIDGSVLTMTALSAYAAGGTSNNYGIYNTSAALTLLGSTVSVSSGPVNTGLYNNGSSATIHASTISVSGAGSNYGLYNDSASVAIQGSVITASGGGPNDGLHNMAVSGAYVVTVDASQITGSTSTIYSDSSHYTTRLGASQLIGSGVQGGGNYICVFSYNASYAALNGSCL